MWFHVFTFVLHFNAFFLNSVGYCSYCNLYSPHHLDLLGIQRRRLIPAPLPDTSSLGMKAGATGQWVDLPPISGPLKEPFEIKVYEIDDVERLQRRRQEQLTEVSK